jgi:DNA-binding transcriptional regulator YiaG
MPREMDGYEFHSIMHKLQLSRLRVAEILGVDVETVFKWENNKQRPPALVINKLRLLMDNKRQSKKN